MATTDGQMAAHGSSIAALRIFLAFDVLEGVAATKSTPDSVGLKLHGGQTAPSPRPTTPRWPRWQPTTALRRWWTSTPSTSLRRSRRWRSTPRWPTLSRDAFISSSNLLNAITTAVLNAALAGKADASTLAALLSIDTPQEVGTKIANLLGLATEAFVFVAAQLASRDDSISGAKADALSLEGVSQMDSIPPGRLLALVRPGNNLFQKNAVRRRVAAK